MTTIAFLGTGLLGAAFAETAAARGDDVVAWNRTESKARALEQFGVRVAATPADAVRDVQRAHLVLPDDAAVEEVIAALRPGLAPETILIDHSTTLPALTAERSRRLNAEGVRYLHCPVFIGPATARRGEGTILVAGPREWYTIVLDDLERMAARVEYCGERPDLAAVYKLCGNGFIIGMNALIADVLSVASGADVAAAEAMRVVQYFDPAAAVTGRGGQMARREYPLGFELAMARKDIRLMIETAGRYPLATLPAIAERMDTLIAAGLGHEDLGIIGSESVDAD